MEVKIVTNLDNKIEPLCFDNTDLYCTKSTNKIQTTLNKKL